MIMETVHDLPTTPAAGDDLDPPAARDDLDSPVEDSLDAATTPTTWADRIGSFRSGATGLTGADLAVLAAVFFLPCAFLPVFLLSWWTPRMMLLIAVIPAGVIMLGRLLRAGDVAARWATAAITVSVVSALAADATLASLKGYVGQDSSVLTVVGAFSLWALARFMSADGRRLVVPVFLAALGANLFIALVEVVARLETGPLALQAGRAAAFTPNPVYLGALMAGGTALCLHRLATVAHQRRAWAIGAFAFASGVAFSGSRVALISVAIIGLYCVIRCDRVWAAIGLASATFGAIAGSLVVRTFVSGRDSVSRLGEAPDSAGRFPIWRVAGDAVSERPIFGWGIGQFRYATQGRLSVEDIAPLNGSSFFDAHNVVVGMAVAVGIPGLICFLGFVWATVRQLSPGVGVAAAAIAITWMLQPLSIVTVPVVFALLGVWSAPRARTASPDDVSQGRRSMRGAVAVGVLVALALGAVDYSFNAAVDSGDLDRALTLEPLYIRDPVVANVVAQSLSFRLDEPESRAQMFDALQRSIDLEPTRVQWWHELARYQGFFGDPEAALESSQQALELEPFERRSWNIVRLTAQELGDESLEREANDVLCRLQVEGACGWTVGDDESDESL